MRKTPSDHVQALHVQALIDDLIAVRASLLAAVRELPPDCLDEPCIGTWAVKDLLAHLIGWDETNLQAVKDILAGQRPSFFQYYDPDWRSYNASLVKTYRIEPFQTLLAEAAKSHSHLVEFLQSLPAEAILQGKSPREQGRSVTIRNLLRAEAADERKHCIQVQEFRAKVLP
jgi:hypothetical protein